MGKMINSPEKQPGRKLFYGLFIFPLLIAVGMAVLLCTVVFLTKETETPESLITAIKTGTPSKRWQKAFELSNELNQGRGLIRESGVMKEVIHILGESKEYDAKTRAYMAIALSKFDDPEVVPALQSALKREQDTEVQLYLIWALGIKKAAQALDQTAVFLKSPDQDLRQMAAYVVGSFQEPRAAVLLHPLLNDGSRDVCWNAALGLARLGDQAAYPVVIQMLDRRFLEQENIPEPAVEEIMVNAAKGLALLSRVEGSEILQKLSREDKSLKVRQAALDALANQKSVSQ